MTVTVNAWTLAAVLTVLVWGWFAAWAREQHGDYNFGPAIVGACLFFSTAALWGGLLLGKWL